MAAVVLGATLFLLAPVKVSATPHQPEPPESTEPDNGTGGTTDENQSNGDNEKGDDEETTTTLMPTTTTLPPAPAEFSVQCDRTTAPEDLPSLRLVLVVSDAPDEAEGALIEFLQTYEADEGLQMEVIDDEEIVLPDEDAEIPQEERVNLQEEASDALADLDPSLTVVAIGKEARDLTQITTPNGPYFPPPNYPGAGTLTSIEPEELVADLANTQSAAGDVELEAVLASDGSGSVVVRLKDSLPGATTAVGSVTATVDGKRYGCVDPVYVPFTVTAADRNVDTGEIVDTYPVDAVSVQVGVVSEDTPPFEWLADDGGDDNPGGGGSSSDDPKDDDEPPAKTTGSTSSPLKWLPWLLVLGLIGAVVYLVNRKPEPQYVHVGGDGYAGGPPGGGAPPPPGPPPLPPRYTEPAPAPVARIPDPAPGWTGTISGGAAVRLEDLGLMRVVARETGKGKVWSHETTEWMLTAGWLEKVAGKGEDSEPAIRMHKSGAGLLGVFDGTGGAGSASARRLTDGSDLSGAYVASRLSKAVTEGWATEHMDHNAAGPVDPEELRDRLARALQDEALYPDVPKSTMKGSLQRVLPTTMAAMAFQVSPGSVAVDALWAGDSRAYALTPRGGLQVLTVDDTRETDALELIRNDQPMANLISADKPFTVNHLRYQIEQPTMLLAATDGCFGYVRTPAHWEFLLLDSLVESATLDAWATEIVSALSSIAADDSSFAIGAFGFGTFAELKEAMRPRRDHLGTNHWAPFQAAAGQTDEIEALRVSSWAAYKDLYHARVLPGQGS